jgi:DNA-binding protein HU-beta
MNRTEFAEKLAKNADISQTKAREILDAIFSTDDRKGIIAIELDAGRDVTITGFGTFTTRRRKAREGRNPQNGKTIQIAASTAPAFRAGKGLKDRVRK